MTAPVSPLDGYAKGRLGVVHDQNALVDPLSLGRDEDKTRAWFARLSYVARLPLTQRLNLPVGFPKIADHRLHDDKTEAGNAGTYAAKLPLETECNRYFQEVKMSGYALHTLSIIKPS